ncbi:phosphocarrier protein HPr (histidine-containing protein) [Mycoplasmopsis californica]|uniref:Phosphocarrier protein HPr n=1 Tax=Mycoplasmopsis equigenitalium TaxID=114883 RepID=A0ABY5J0I1_9BACT|nr:HPr family phosphocarrier protein [Mycoplasmopsis equigenitalium]UUD36764.1 HPr family phosphocarrier protein [Mycoplasmopsis equigenitalium]VEU69940.1 phosphocarrier protein HPr (histidine-containing protein) [Mycoplasmopsis californica]
MKEIKVTIIDPIGLHARPASQLCQEAAKYSSKIELKTATASGNLKSIMNIMSLGVKTNTTVTITADGSDEAAAIEGLKKVMIANNIIDK